jgi:hypothetical protein
MATPDETSEVFAALLRSIVSFVIFVHLFCVFVALSANSIRVSELHSTLAALLGRYTQALNLEPPFSHDPNANLNEVVPYFLTYAREEDVDHRLEVLPAGSDPAANENWIVLPGDEFRGGEQYKRYQRLARLLAFHGGNEVNENPSASMSQGIARHFLVVRGVQPQLVRSRRHSLLHWTTLAIPDQRDPWSRELFTAPYTAQVLMEENAIGGVIKQTPDRETAGAATDAKP